MLVRPDGYVAWASDDPDPLASAGHHVEGWAPRSFLRAQTSPTR